MVENNRIEYLEFWATRHCNMGCRGCSSCAPIAEPWFLSEDSLSRDLRRLVDIGLSVGCFAVLGGEPLLHPNLLGLFRCVRRHFPRAQLGLITNGVLLPQQDSMFLRFCRENAVKINVTLFPVMSEMQCERIRQLLTSWGIEYRLTVKRFFNKILTLDRSSPLEAVRRACGCKGACNLHEGYVSRCTVPMVVGTLNRRYGCGFVETGRLCIGEASADEIVRFLKTPNDSCRNCSAHPVKVPWSLADACPEVKDWIVGE